MSLIFALYRYYPTVKITLCFPNARMFDKLNELSKFLPGKKEEEQRLIRIDLFPINVNDML